MYGVGTDRGIHYYAMQFIKGQSLARVLTELRGEDLSLPPTASANLVPGVPLPLQEDSPTSVAAALSTELSEDRAGYGRSVVRLVKQVDEAFELLTADAGLTGTFAALDLPDLGEELFLDPQYGENGFSLRTTARA